MASTSNNSHDRTSISSENSSSSSQNLLLDEEQDPVPSSAQKCRRCSLHFGLLCWQVITLAVSAAISALFIRNHGDNWGQCLMTAFYSYGGIVTYSDDVIPCDSVAYVVLVGGSFILSSICVNWIAGLRFRKSYIKYELLGSVVIFFGSAITCGLLIWHFVHWCHNITYSFQCRKGDDLCISWTDLDEMSCYDKVTQFDAANFSSYDHMTLNYESMFNQAVLLVISAIMWFITIIILAKLLKQINQEGTMAGFYKFDPNKPPKRFND